MSDSSPRIVLGSRSPQRHELLVEMVGDERVEVLPPSSAEEPGFGDTSERSSIRRRLIAIARAKAEERRAQAVAQQQEMQATTVENPAQVLLAEAEVPQAMADAFEAGNLRAEDSM